MHFGRRRPPTLTSGSLQGAAEAGAADDCGSRSLHFLIVAQLNVAAAAHSPGNCEACHAVEPRHPKRPFHLWHGARCRAP